jgi:uncharacterized membrane protein YccC
VSSVERPANDGRDVLPELRVSDVLRQRPAPFRSVRQIVRIAIAVTVSWAVGYWVSPSNFGIFAPLTTLLVVSSSPWSTFGLSMQRILSTAIGVLATTLWVSFVDITWWSVLIAILAALLIASRLPLSLGGQLQIPTAVLFVFALGQVTWEQAGWRVLDVAIGGALGIVAIYLPPPKPRPERYEAALQEYRDRILELLEDMGRELRETSTVLPPEVLHNFIVSSRALRGYAEKAREALVDLAETAAFNPRGRAARALLDDDALRLRRLASIGVHVRGIAGVINHGYDREQFTPALDKSLLATLLVELADLGRVALGSCGAPVRPESAEATQIQADALDAQLREIADSLARGSTGDVLESVSLLGRIAYVVGQFAAFASMPGEDEEGEDD